LAVIFLAVSMSFVYKSFYGMRIEGSGEPASTEKPVDREPMAVR